MGEEKTAFVTDSNLLGTTYGWKDNRGFKSGKGKEGHVNPLTCNHCRSRGHTQNKCYSLHGFPPKIANAAQTQFSTNSDGNATSPNVPSTG